MKQLIVTLSLITTGCVSSSDGEFNDPKPLISQAEFKEIVSKRLKSPSSVRDFAMSREPYVIGPDAFGQKHWIVCANYFATNSYGALVRGGLTAFFKNGNIVDIRPTEGYGCETAVRTPWP